MYPQILIIIPTELLSQLGGRAGWSPWLALVGFAADQGLNPEMGWLFALSMGL